MPGGGRSVRDQGATACFCRRPSRTPPHLRYALLVGAALAPFVVPAAGVALTIEPERAMWTARDGLGIVGPRGVAFDTARGEILVADTGGGRVVVFDLAGLAVTTVRHRVTRPDGSRTDGHPRQVVVHPDGRLLVSDDLAYYVSVLDPSGREVGRLELPSGQELPYGEFPGSVALTPEGSILVAARGKAGRVYRFSSDLVYLGSWGVAGSQPGHLSGVTGLAVLPDGEVVVTCVATELAVQIFDLAGRHLRGFGRHEIGPGNFSFPSSVAVTRDGTIFVSDELRQTVQVFDREGSLLGVVGKGGTGPGEFLYPSALATDGEGLLAVAERVGNRVQLLRIRR